MKAAVPVAAIRQTWKCSGSVIVAQLYHCGTFVSVFQTHTQRGRRAGRRDGAPRGRALRGLAAAHAAGVIVVGHSNKAARKKEKQPDVFDSGLVSGSAAWHDGVRGVLSLQWRIGGASGARDLVCPKSNHGPARMVCGLDAIRDQEPDGAIIGFEAAGVGWHAPRKGDSDERPKRASGVAETVA